MGGGQSEAANQAYGTEQYLSNAMYDISRGATKAGLGYLTGEYGRGGFDFGPKYQAMQTDVLEKSLGRSGSFLNPQGMGDVAAARAAGVSAVGQQKITSGMDEMNKLRSQLAGQGLATTNFAEQAGRQSVAAIGNMAYNPTMSTISALGGLGAAVYGGFNQPTKTTNTGGSFTGWGSAFGIPGTPQDINVPVTSLVPPGQWSLFNRGPGG